MFFICYKIKNKINSKIYIGVHKTNNINDGYMGSGVLIKKAILKYGIYNFEKVILKEFENLEEMLEYEKYIVNKDFVNSNNTYNLTIGGGNGYWSIKPTYNMIVCKDINDNIFHISKDDPRYLNNELVPIRTGNVTVKDKLNNIFSVKTNDQRYLSEEVVFISKNTVNVRDSLGNTFRVSKDDPRYLSGELISANKNIKKSTLIAIDNYGVEARVNVDDKRLLSGELKNKRMNTFVSKDQYGNNVIVNKSDINYNSEKFSGIAKGTKVVYNKITLKNVRINVEDFDESIHIENFKNKIVAYDEIGNKYKVEITDQRYLSGELKAKTTKNQITVKDNNGNTFNIFKDDSRYLSGELKAINSGTITINNGIKMKRIPKDSIIPDGWIRGMIKKL